MELLDLVHELRGVWWLVFIVTFIAAIILLRSLFRWVDKQQLVRRIKARSVMTPNEEEFFGRLKRALPDYDVLAQVAMGALLTTEVPEGDPEFWEIRNQFSQKIVDYVVLKRGTSKVIAVIELDDRTHDPEKDAKRDALLAAAGIRTIRFESRAKPSEAEIRRRIEELARAGK